MARMLTEVFFAATILDADLTDIEPIDTVPEDASLEDLYVDPSSVFSDLGRGGSFASLSLPSASALPISALPTSALPTSALRHR